MRPASLHRLHAACPQPRLLAHAGRADRPAPDRRVAARGKGRPFADREAEGSVREGAILQALAHHRGRTRLVGGARGRARTRGGGYRLDRKSVVEGKRVSVRVDLGGGSIMKKRKGGKKWYSTYEIHYTQ